MSTIALVGRANVGKSTLFNRLCGKRDALVHDRPGLTRDRRYGQFNHDGIQGTLIDVGGLGEESPIAHLIEEQVDQAVAEADLSLLLVDGDEGFSTLEEDLAQRLRQRGNQVLVVLNKVDLCRDESLPIELSRLGFGEPIEISAKKGRGILELMDEIARRVPEQLKAADLDMGIKVAIVGRSNVGKSTLVNTLVGDNRCIVFDAIGTTRDAVDVPLTRPEGDYLLIDTAGIRRKGRVDDVLEKFLHSECLQCHGSC